MAGMSSVKRSIDNNYIGESPRGIESVKWRNKGNNSGNK